MKRCNACSETKPLSEFWRNGQAADGRHWWCKSCAKEKSRGYKSQQAGRQRTGYYLKYRYGITMDERDDMERVQKGLCAICHVRRKLVVDHCHSTGAVRGLLCIRCNVALGTIGDPNVARAAAYVA